MKTKKIYFPILVCIFLHITACNNTNNFLDPPIFGNDEDAINLAALEEDDAIAEREISDSKHFFQIGGSTLTLNPASIDTVALKKFRTEIASSLPGTLTPCDDIITGIRVYYAIEPGTIPTFTLYYKAVKFCRENENYGQGGQHYGFYRVGESSNFYKYAAGSNSLTEIPAGQTSATQNKIDSYTVSTTGIQIRRSQGGGFTNYSYYSNISGDVKSVTFSFQELLTLARATKSKYIRFWNAAKKIKTHSNDLIKHTLLISSDNVGYSGGNVSLPPLGAGIFANLSHLCPPSCNGDVYIYQLVY